ILRLMKKNNIKVDAVSLGEIERALIAGFNPQNNDIVFTADILEEDTLSKIIEKNIPMNAGSLNMLEQLGAISQGHHV
ncbi:diaminopimelate decarboxylase, partial [Buchnera aphidicola]|nr:diaminopimelate decarboxylase [Buchnera aphidicola]